MVFYKPALIWAWPLGFPSPSSKAWWTIVLRFEMPVTNGNAAATSQRTVVASNSLLGLMKRHERKSLFVHPIHWFNLHAKLLGVYFRRVPQLSSMGDARGADQDPSHDIVRTLTLIRVFDSPLRISEQANRVNDLLKGFWPKVFADPKTRYNTPQGFWLLFDNCVYNYVLEVQAAWSFPEGSVLHHHLQSQSACVALPEQPKGVPLFIFLSKSYLAGLRKFHHRNASTLYDQRIYRKRQLTNDVYLVSVFLAMAQSYWMGQPPLKEGQPTLRFPKPLPQQYFGNTKMTILSFDDETAEFIVYTGFVTGDFLRRFYAPAEKSFHLKRLVPGIKIEVRRVPVRPVQTFQDRLGTALGQSIIEHLGDDHQHAIHAQVA